MEEANKLTVVFRVFDWDHYKKSDKIGEVLKSLELKQKKS